MKKAIIAIVVLVLVFFIPLCKGGVEGEVYSSREILQFRSGGQILGFTEQKMYVVGMGCALTEGFIGARKVTPLPEGEAVKPGQGNKGTLEFQGVRYPGLWEGIDLIYEPNKGGLARSKYIISSGADPGRIMLRYNADFQIKQDGSLVFMHPTELGYFRMTAPQAWQEIGGTRIPVEVRFRKIERRTLGFNVSAYNRAYPLIIDPSYEWYTFYGCGYLDYGNSIAVNVATISIWQA